MRALVLIALLAGCTPEPVPAREARAGCTSETSASDGSVTTTVWDDFGWPEQREILPLEGEPVVTTWVHDRVSGNVVQSTSETGVVVQVHQYDGHEHLTSVQTRGVDGQVVRVDCVNEHGPDGGLASSTCGEVVTTFDACDSPVRIEGADAGVPVDVRLSWEHDAWCWPQASVEQGTDTLGPYERRTGYANGRAIVSVLDREGVIEGELTRWSCPDAG